MIQKIYIRNFKQFEEFELDFESGLSIIVGDNEVGKSTIIEALVLALTKKLNGRLVDFELTPYIFNRKTVEAYIAALKAGIRAQPPEVLIEVYLAETAETARLKGENNHFEYDQPGISLRIVFDDKHIAEYTELIKDGVSEYELFPTDFYKVEWFDFGENAISIRSLPLKISSIDTTQVQLSNSADAYLKGIIQATLSVTQRKTLSHTYKGIQSSFSDNEAIEKINKELKSKKTMSEREITIGIDLSNKNAWENNLIPHLDQLPFYAAGKGEQSILKMMLTLDMDGEECHIILIEEPENHLTHMRMHELISQITKRYDGKQIIITTHSNFVLNKLGLKSLILLGKDSAKARLNDLSEDTQAYFQKLPGYDTLRLVLARKTILVEGPSDELLVQRAYKDKHNALPIENGVDVLCIRGLSFKRYLELASKLEKEVLVVRDNDKKAEKIEEGYQQYLDGEKRRLCMSSNNALNTLEPQITSVNTLELLNTILDKQFATKDELTAYMQKNKVDVALEIFDAEQSIIYPDYIIDAITEK